MDFINVSIIIVAIIVVIFCVFQMIRLHYFSKYLRGLLYEQQSKALEAIAMRKEWRHLYNIDIGRSYDNLSKKLFTFNWSKVLVYKDF